MPHSELTLEDQGIIQLLESVMLFADAPPKLPFPYRHLRGANLYDGIHFTANDNGIVIQTNSEDACRAIVSFMFDTLGLTAKVMNYTRKTDLLIPYDALSAEQVRGNIARIIASSLGIPINRGGHSQRLGSSLDSPGMTRA